MGTDSGHFDGSPGLAELRSGGISPRIPYQLTVRR